MSIKSPTAAYFQPKMHELPQTEPVAIRPSQSGNWSHSLFDCSDNFSSFLIAWCLPCVAFGLFNFHVLKLGINKREFDGSSFLQSCLLWSLLETCIGASCCYGAGTRCEIRDANGIPGNFMTDLAVHTFCLPCGLTQENVEIADIGGRREAFKRLKKSQFK